MKCPGQDMQYWKDDAIFEVKCPECSAFVEFYKDDTTRKCHKCSHRFVNPKMDFGCATYCQFAEQCLGTLPEDFVMQQDTLLKDKVAVEVKRYFKTDFKRISFATKIARYAERIGKATEGTNLALILCSSYLHNIGYTEAARHTAEVRRQHLQQYGPVIAREILAKLGANEELIAQVCSIIGESDEPQAEKTSLESAIVEDAYILTMLENDHTRDMINETELQSRLQGLKTEKAKEEAKSIVGS